jgi:hypothetical protein
MYFHPPEMPGSLQRAVCIFTSPVLFCSYIHPVMSEHKNVCVPPIDEKNIRA